MSSDTNNPNEKIEAKTAAPAAPAPAAKPAAAPASAAGAPAAAPAPAAPTTPIDTGPVPFVATERPRSGSFVSRFLGGLGSLLKGLKITLHYFTHPSTVVTQQYPENRETLKMAERLRAQLSFTMDENGYHKCTACHICEQNCPNASIHVVERPKPAVARAEIDQFIWRLDTCTFCNICVLVCPFSVLKMKTTFESAVYDQRLLVYNLTPYAGPTATALAKIADPEERKKTMEARDPYPSTSALAGFKMAGIPGMEPEVHKEPAK